MDVLFSQVFPQLRAEGLGVPDGRRHAGTLLDEIHSAGERLSDLRVGTIRVAQRQNDEPLVRRQPVPPQQHRHALSHLLAQLQVAPHFPRLLPVHHHPAVQRGGDCQRDASGANS